MFLGFEEGEEGKEGQEVQDGAVYVNLKLEV